MYMAEMKQLENPGAASTSPAPAAARESLWRLSEEQRAAPWVTALVDYICEAGSTSRMDRWLQPTAQCLCSTEKSGAATVLLTKCLTLLEVPSLFDGEQILTLSGVPSPPNGKLFAFFLCL